MTDIMQANEEQIGMHGSYQELKGTEKFENSKCRCDRIDLTSLRPTVIRFMFGVTLVEKFEPIR